MKFEILTSEEEIKSLIEFHNKNSKFVVLDTETTSAEPRECSLIDIQITGRYPGSAALFKGTFCNLLSNFSKNLPMVGHNYKFDVQVLYRHGVDLLDNNWIDTIILGHLVDENRESYSLDSYVKEYFNDDYKEKFWGKYKCYEEAPESERTEYACRDIVYTGELFTRLERRLQESDLPLSLRDRVCRLQTELLKTEMSGIRVDTEYLISIGTKLKSRIEQLDPQMRSLVKDNIELYELNEWQKQIDLRKTDKGKKNVKRPIFNFESSKQLQWLLYNSLGLPVQTNEKTKAISTDYSSLERIKSNHEVVALIQENRELQKVYNTYIDGTLSKLSTEQRIYPEFRVTGTVTGRISHSNPNLAQLPRQGGIRGIYVPDRGRVFISADYSQLEVVVEAHYTGDKNLIHMLENGESKHDLTARELGCDRNTAKTLNFALQYWASHFKVAKLLNCQINEAKRIWERYWEIYSGPKSLKSHTDYKVNNGIPITTILGRQRHFEVKDRKEWDSDYRQAYNFLIQSTGADITSIAFCNISKYLESNKIGRGLFTVHDEILIEVEEQYWEQANGILINYMQDISKEIGLKVPLKAESSGKMYRWED